MSAKRYKQVRLSSVQKIRKARQALQNSPKSQQIAVMVKAGALTEAQAAQAKKKLAETAG